MPLSDAAKALVDSPEYAVLATVGPDNQPQLSVVWVGREDEDLVISTVKDRQKTRNVATRGKATVLIYPAANPHDYLEVRGAASVEEDPTSSLIHTLARKYTGAAFTGDIGTNRERVIIRIRPEHVVFSTGN